MSRKAETIFTSRMLNKAAHEKRKAAREARRVRDGLVRFTESRSNHPVCYVQVSGVAFPLSQNL